MSSRLQKEDDENSWSWSGLALTGALVGGIGALFGYFVYNSLSEQEVLRIPVQLAPAFGRPSECSICLNDIQHNSEIRRLKCGHVYHSKCILEWVQRRQTCPLCRQSTV